MAKTTKSDRNDEPRDKAEDRCACPFERLFSDMFRDPHLHEARDKMRSSSAELLRAVRAVLNWGITRMESEAAEEAKLHKVTID